MNQEPKKKPSCLAEMGLVVLLTGLLAAGVLYLLGPLLGNMFSSVGGMGLK